ncbi:MAG: hypothetical protein BWY71_01602 [Planctomycetes bacterium ADurb.Bin412]|nr:MAG: hypothetical protein BWY71_01602 [Planctomycetes bacterium ADurb.Bin412]
MNRAAQGSHKFGGKLLVGLAQEFGGYAEFQRLEVDLVKTGGELSNGGIAAESDLLDDVADNR